jgi:hypothetical protein
MGFLVGQATEVKAIKMAPFLGPKLKEAKWRVKSGMATQRAAPRIGAANREI